MLKDFKTFLLRGNVIDLAVGVIMGAAFGSVVSALVADLLTPLIAALVKIPDFSGFAFTINGSKFMIGHFINTIISFVLVSTAVFFFIVKPMNMIISKTKKETPAIKSTKICPECLSEIPIRAKRCAYCAQLVK